MLLFRHRSILLLTPTSRGRTYPWHHSLSSALSCVRQGPQDDTWNPASTLPALQSPCNMTCPRRVVPASPLAQAPLRTAPSHFTQLITMPWPRLPLSLSSLPPVESVWVTYCFSGPIMFTHISVTASSSLGVAWGKEGVCNISACVHAVDTCCTQQVLSNRYPALVFSDGWWRPSITPGQSIPWSKLDPFSCYLFKEDRRRDTKDGVYVTCLVWQLIYCGDLITWWTWRWWRWQWRQPWQETGDD